MTGAKKDPSLPIRERASRYPEVVEGTACTQSSFKTAKGAFLFIGMQGGRHKMMLKLDASLPEAAALARAEPDRYQVGSGGWVTARFTAEEPMRKALWTRWLDESYAMRSTTEKAAEKSAEKTAKKAGKQTSKKTTVRKTASKQGASGSVRKKATRRSS